MQLQGTLAKQEKEMLAAARTLSDARKAAAKALEERILRELRELDMNKVIRMCLIPDLGECFTGDIPTYLKS